MSRFTEDAHAYEGTAERLLTDEDSAPHTIAEAQAWATLALANRVAEQTEQLAHGVLVMKGS